MWNSAIYDLKCFIITGVIDNNYIWCRFNCRHAVSNDGSAVVCHTDGGYPAPDFNGHESAQPYVMAMFH